jgi:hypothetical protein
MRYLRVFALLALIGCSRGAGGPAPTTGDQATPRAPGVEVAAADAKMIVAPPKIVGNLAVYPLLSKTQTDPGRVITLEEALQKGLAEVREVGATAAAPEPSDARHNRRQARSGPTVGTLVIENKGSDPVFVIAGTVVKGGNQDRQISQDFVIDGKQTVPVDAFCVEQGRWRGDREGQMTGGQFGSTAIVATSKVRAAGQYKKDQGEVWAKVAEANAAHKKSASTGTFMATLDDAEIAKQRVALAKDIETFLDGVKPPGDVVGVAYAVDGQIKGARAFAHSRLFKMFQSKLAQSIALEALTARAEAAQAGKPAFSGAAPPASGVDVWMKDIEAQSVREKRDTAAANENEYKESDRAYGSKTMMKPKAATPGAPPAPARAISVDFLAK